MGMNLGSGGGDGDPDVLVDVNTTPLIDVMLVLLVMLIITIPIQTHAVKMDLPQNRNPPANATPPPAVDLEIDFDGTYLWNGTPIDAAVLDTNFTREGRASVDSQSEVRIRPNKLVEYKYVAHVLAAAQRHGVVKIGMVGNEQFMQP